MRIVSNFGLRTSFGCRLRCGFGDLSRSAPVVFGEQAFEDFFTGGGADGVADAVVFGEGFDFDEVVAEIEVGPAVGVTDGEVDFAVQAAQFEDALIAGFGFQHRLLADAGDFGGREVAGVEQVVDVSEAEPEALHQGAAVFVVALAEGYKVWVSGLPETLREREIIETLGRRIAQVLFQRTTVFTRPAFVNC